MWFNHLKYLMTYNPCQNYIHTLTFQSFSKVIVEISNKSKKLCEWNRTHPRVLWHITNILNISPAHLRRQHINHCQTIMTKFPDKCPSTNGKYLENLMKNKVDFLSLCGPIYYWSYCYNNCSFRVYCEIINIDIHNCHLIIKTADSNIWSFVIWFEIPSIGVDASDIFKTVFLLNSADHGRYPFFWVLSGLY